MNLFLSLETSTHHFSCALHRDNELIAFEESIAEQSTASLLAVMVDKLFIKSGMKKIDLKAVIVASGPGSYTGLRIGVATAKGLCYALSVPLISINTLLLMANQFVNSYSSEIASDSILCPMLDARRMEVYCLLVDQKLRIIEPTHAKIIDEKSFVHLLDKKMIYFFGEGSEKCKNVINHSNARFMESIKPSALTLGIVGFQKFLLKDFEDTAHFEPFYLKDFVIKKPNLVS